MRHRQSAYARLLKPGDRFVEFADPTKVWVVADRPYLEWEDDEHGYRTRVPVVGDDALALPLDERVKLWNEYN